MREFFIEAEEVRLEAERVYSIKIPEKVKECVLKADFETRYAFIAITGYYDENGQYVEGLIDKASEKIPFYSVADILVHIYNEMEMKAETAKGEKLQHVCNIMAACNALIMFLCDTEPGELEE